MYATYMPSSPSIVDLDDPALLRHARAGDADAVAELYHRLAPEARRFARRLVAHSDVEDVVAEAFTKVLRAVRNGRGPVDHPVKYLMVAVRTTAWRTKRQLAREAEMAPFVAGPASSELDVRFGDPELVEALADLPLRQRSAVWWADVEGASAQEIGERLGLSANAAAALTYRARRNLRDAYLGRLDRCDALAS